MDCGRGARVFASGRWLLDLWESGKGPKGRPVKCRNTDAVYTASASHGEQSITTVVLMKYDMVS